MNCIQCGKKLAQKDRFCSQCGTATGKNQPPRPDIGKINPEVEYKEFLPIGGWVIVVMGALVGLMLIIIGAKLKDGGGIVISGFGFFIESCIIAMLYFGLHKAIMKITRLEQALGIAGIHQKGKTIESKPAGEERPEPTFDGADQDELPWELREDDE